MGENPTVGSNCESGTPAELTASKILSSIGRSPGDYELEMKIRKSNMTIESITELIHEYMYDRLNDSTTCTRTTVQTDVAMKLQLRKAKKETE